MAKRRRPESPPEEQLDAAAAAAYLHVAQGRAKEEQSLLHLTKEGPENPDTKDFCGAFAAIGMDNSWDLQDFRKGFSIQLQSMSDDVVEFDMIGIDPPLVNAFRRILIAEVPTIAISRVTISQNTGFLHDENLAHRLGLIPIAFEPDNLKWRAADADFLEENSVKFSLNKVCSQKQDKVNVYSKDLVWTPMTHDQHESFKDAPPRPVAGDILITQLRPGQELELECLCEKGLGKEHAKWSPVCTAFYRLMPVIKLTRPIEGDEAELLKRTCPRGVFDIEDLGGGQKKATVANARKCTTCRECIESFPGEDRGLILAKDKRHFIFTIESVGQVLAPVLFERALEKLRDKCETAKSVLAKHQN